MDSLKIPVELDDKRIDAGVKNISKSLSKLKDTLNTAIAGGVDIGFGALTRLKSLVSNILGFLMKGLAAFMVVFALSMRKIFTDIREAVDELITKNLKGTKIADDLEKLKGGFTELKMAIAAAFLPLIEAAIPYLQRAVDWLIKALNYAAMITAAFMGQKQALQIIPGSAAKLAKSTKETEKAAKNTLAAFDQLNVLQRDTAKTQEANPATVATQMLPVTDDILKKVQALKDLWSQLWTDPIPLLKSAWGMFRDWIKTNILDPIAAWWVNTWLFKNVFAPILGWAIEAWNNIRLGAETAWLVVSNFAGIAWAKILEIWGTFKDWFRENVATPLAIYFTLALNMAIGKVNELREKFLTRLEEVRQKWQEVFAGIQTFVQNTINNILAFINSMIQGVINGINIVSGLLTGKTPQAPQLSTGTTAPANATMSGSIGGRSGGRSAIEQGTPAGGDMTITMPVYLDGEKIYENQKKVTRRHGNNMIVGGSVD